MIWQRNPAHRAPGTHRAGWWTNRRAAVRRRGVAPGTPVVIREPESAWWDALQSAVRSAGGVTDDYLNQLMDLCQPGDLFVDGANSRWKDTKARAERIKARLLVLNGGADPVNASRVASRPSMVKIWRLSAPASGVSAASSACCSCGSFAQMP